MLSSQCGCALTGVAAETAHCSGKTSRKWYSQVTQQINEQTTKTTGPEVRESVSRVAGYNYYLRCSAFIKNYEQLRKETRKYNPNRKIAGSRTFL